MKENTDVEVDSDVSLEIPPGTVIAYSILELVIRKDGQYGEDVGPCRGRKEKILKMLPLITSVTSHAQSYACTLPP